MAEAQFLHGYPLMVDHTPGSAVAAGQVVVVSNTPYVAHLDIAANKLGALAARGGVYKGAAAAAVATKGIKIYWDDTANEFTATATGNKHFGFSAGASYDGDAFVNVEHAPLGESG